MKNLNKKAALINSSQKTTNPKSFLMPQLMFFSSGLKKIPLKLNDWKLFFVSNALINSAIFSRKIKKMLWVAAKSAKRRVHSVFWVHGRRKLGNFPPLLSRYDRRKPGINKQQHLKIYICYNLKILKALFV